MDDARVVRICFDAFWLAFLTSSSRSNDGKEDVRPRGPRIDFLYSHQRSGSCYGSYGRVGQICLG